MTEIEPRLAVPTASLSRTRSVRRRSALLAATALLASTLSAGGALLVTAAPAQAWASANVDFAGHGNGHGRGMGQWGAYGYAVDYSWTYTQILNHFYGGTSVRTVGLAPVTVDLSELDGDGSVTVTSGAAFSAGGVSVPAHGSAKISYVGTNAFDVQTSSGGCGTALGTAKRVSSGLIKSGVAAPSSLTQMLTVCASNRTYRGTLTLTYGSGASRVVNTVAMDDYLRGVVPRESIASWGDAGGGKGMAALQAQAVAARSYAAVSRRYSWANICDTTTCQVYGGAGLNGSVIEDPRTNTAVTSTSAQCLENSANQVVSAEYSASTGGYTAGGTFPAVPDLGDVESPDHNWTASVPASTVGSTFGVGTLQKITMTRNGLGADGGRVLSVTITGSAGTDTETGASFAYALGLKSDWFTVHNPVIPMLIYTNESLNPKIDMMQAFGMPGDIPLACDFNGDGTDTGAVYRANQGLFFIRNSFAPGAPLTEVRLGTAGDLPVCGDWNGDGTDTVGVYDPRTAMFYLLNTNARTASTPLIRVLLGGGGYLPVAGDFNGDHHDTLGVFDPKTATWWLVNSLAAGAPRTSFRWGLPGDAPVVGDWDGNGTDTPGILRGGRTWAVTNDLTTRRPTYFRYGLPGDVPLVGDWNHDKLDTVAVGRGYTS